MKKYLFIIAAAATCMLVACSKEKELRAPETTNVEEEFVHLPGWTYISATGNETATAASINGTSGAFTWNTGDQIALFANGAYQKSAELSSSFNNQASAEFAFEGVNAYRSDFAVFPADLVFDGDNVRTSSATNHTASALTITLPASYPITKVKDDACPTPMIAVNGPDQALYFKSLCAILRVTLTNVPKQTTSIDFVFGGKKVNGEFTLNDVDLSNLASFKGVEVAAASSAADSVISVTGISLNALTKDYVVNVPVPAGVASTGEYTTVTVTTRDSGGHKINSFRSVIKTTGTGKWVPTRVGARKLAVTLPVFTLQGNIGFNNGVKAVFAPGNLQATVAAKASNKTSDKGQAVLAKVDVNSYRFATHQYDFIGVTTGNKLTAANMPVDLFNWTGASADPMASDPTDPGYLGLTEDQYGMLYPSLNNAGQPFFYAKGATLPDGTTASSAVSNWYYYTGTWDGTGDKELLKKDWGAWVISDEVGAYPANTWRTPNSGSSGVSEWSRVTASRKSLETGNPIIDYLAAKATLNDANGNRVAWGFIIFPDSFDPAGLPTINNHSNGTIASSLFSGNVLNLAQWEQFEAVGCVFLPANNMRQSSSGIKIYNDADCTYWANYGQSGSSPKAACFLCNDYSLKGSTSSDTGQTIHSYESKQYFGDKGMGRQYGCGVRLVRVIN